MTPFLRALGRGAAIAAALPACYLLAALILGLLPANRDARPAASGVPVYLDSNGVHTSLVLPAQTAAADWKAQFPPERLRRSDRFGGAPYVAIGWGSRAFYLETRNWSDLTPGKTLAALAYDRSVLHVEYLWQAPANAGRLLLAPDQYARLADFVRRSAATDAAGLPRWLPGRHYDDNDAFYQAMGRYTPIQTCNQWVRDALDAAGARTALWAPFSQPLFWHIGH
ncbi:TIGR02117 family protein [Chromobacterium vaccinii]|uniref:TIGR02117 family protein n=1 Tax=Chromobacterium vaccinii TaxID=1108595 RepID=UPI003C72798E